MKQSMKKTIWLFCLAPILLLACSSDEPESSNRKNSETSKKYIKVETATVETHDLKETVQGIGTLESIQSVVLKPEVSGVIEEIHFKEGEEVQKGQLLFSINDKKIREQLKARQAALREARAGLENARLHFGRIKSLYNRGSESQAALDEAETALEKARSTIERIQAEIAGLEETLEDTRILAPFPGILGELKVDEGDWVDIGTPLVPLLKTHPLEIAFTVPEKYLGRVKTGQEVEIQSPAHGERTFSGRVYFVSPLIKKDTRDLLVKATLNNSENLLAPGGFASVKLTLGLRRQVPVIPEEGLIPTRTGYMVFVLKDSRAHGRKVEIGLRRPGVVEIKKGVEPGETIIRSGHISVYEGALCKAEK